MNRVVPACVPSYFHFAQQNGRRSASEEPGSGGQLIGGIDPCSALRFGGDDVIFLIQIKLRLFITGTIYMRKNIKKIDRLTVLQIRLYKYILKHYKSVLNASYFLFLILLTAFTVYYLWHEIVRDATMKNVLSSCALVVLSIVALTNFLVAYAFALYRERQLKGLKNMIVIDELTGVYNKRYFLSRLHNEILRARRYNHILSLVVLDIDHFKKLNDTYGHMCGDFILRAIAQIIRGQVRVVDAVCRFGGEEFVVICPETGVHETKTIAERIRKEIEIAKFSYHGKEIGATVSAGVNHLDPLKAKSEMTLFSGADKALYVAKNSGRNRVVIYSSLPANVTASLSKVKRREKVLKTNDKKEEKKKRDTQLSL
jgi:diguanylate cyclase (GGDEF)-like protein